MRLHGLGHLDRRSIQIHRAVAGFSQQEKILRNPFEPSEKPSDLVAFDLESAVVAPGIEAIGFGRHDLEKAQFQRKLAGFRAFVGAVQQQRQAIGTSDA